MSNRKKSGALSPCKSERSTEKGRLRVREAAEIMEFW
jgi:hypothetical protein